MIAAPMPSVLALRHADDETIKLLAHRDLAREARIVLRLGGKAQHARLLRSRHRGAGFVEPSRVDIDVAGGAGAFAAAIGINAGHVVADRAAHHRQPYRHLNLMSGPIVLDIGDFWHEAALLLRAGPRRTNRPSDRAA